MKEVTVGQDIRTLIKNDEPCPLCGKKDRNFSWNMFHGEATASCCKVSYQLKGYHIDNPTEDQKNFLELLDGDYIWLKIDHQYIKPIHQAFKDGKVESFSDKDFNTEVDKYIKEKV